MMNGVDLFTGIGGLTIALGGVVRPVAYCESDSFAQAVLLSRMAEGLLPVAPIWDDIRTLRGDMLPHVDIVYGGFPCTDISSAGGKSGLDGSESRLVYELVRLVDELRPEFVFLENVASILVRGLGKLLGQFSAIGYDSRLTIVSASSVGCAHQRERFFMLSYLSDAGSGRQPHRGAKSKRPFAWQKCEEARRQWEALPKVCGSSDVVPYRVDRIERLGNSVVPLQAREAFKKLMGIDQ